MELGEYYIARYPVTVAQFKSFVEASKYKPQDPRSLGGLPNHPVVSITWYDALAYCNWLTELLSNGFSLTGEIAEQVALGWRIPVATVPSELTDCLRQGWRVTLPSEAEWERAARGIDGRIYPWGAEFDPDKANTYETGIGGTSAVGCFPLGASPAGLLDASGNVWEWTRSTLEKYPYLAPGLQRNERERFTSDNEDGMVLRGGSWYVESWDARCASRDRFIPDVRGDLVGFRVSLSPL